MYLLFESKNLILETNLNNNDEHSQHHTSTQTDENITSNLENPTQSNKPNNGNFEEKLLIGFKLKFLYYHYIYKNLLLIERKTCETPK